MISFDSKEASFRWMDETVCDPCVDNHRFAYVDDDEAIEKYNQQCKNGCCGSFDQKVTVNGKEAMIGCNYGH